MKIWIVLWDQNYNPETDRWCQGGLLCGVYKSWDDAYISIKDELKRRQSADGSIPQKFKRMEDIEDKYSSSPNWFVYEVDGNKYYSYVIVEHTLEFIPEVDND